MANSDFLKIFKSLTYRYSPWEVWADFVSMAACAISNRVDRRDEVWSAREERYMTTINKYSEEERKQFPELFAETVNALEANPDQDFLGSLYMELELSNHWKGQFFTPYCVCEMMAKISMDDLRARVNEQGHITLNDPACGAGATLIAGVHEAKRALEPLKLNWQNHVAIAAQDIDPVTAMMCYIQLSLLGAPGYIKVGNTISDPMSENDDKTQYWYTPMWFSDVWRTRRLVGRMRKLFEGTEGMRVEDIPHVIEVVEPATAAEDTEIPQAPPPLPDRFEQISMF